MFSNNYRLILDEPDSQVYSNDEFSDNIPGTENIRIYFQKDIGEALNKLSSVNGWDNVHSCYFEVSR